eukprot:4773443-Pyramimonas_sp.AAC.1
MLAPAEQSAEPAASSAVEMATVEAEGATAGGDGGAAEAAPAAPVSATPQTPASASLPAPTFPPPAQTALPGGMTTEDALRAMQEA